MRRTLALPVALVVASFLAGCGGDDHANSNNSNATRNSAVQTNANISPTANANNVPSNTAVVTNNNGNANTAGVNTLNSNGRNANNGNSRNGNGNR
ncbi:MAG TPA: hypothetical protein VF544_06845 [Pyrinomonadaceae bacterium]|jgi:6-phosphogluconolactonase/glucosamine-6-phosphate isomerase/deaminase